MENLFDERLNSSLFLQYIKFCGFDPECYEGILELVQSPFGSMSQFLKEYNQCLLSKQVTYDDLDKVGIKGINGYLCSDDIFVPYNKDVPNTGRKSRLSVADFDVIIANGNDETLHFSLNHNKDLFLGYCVSKDDERLDNLRIKFSLIANAIHFSSNNNYAIYRDDVSSCDKELFLVSRKAKKKVLTCR